jgi:hypothetical protein
MAASRASSTWDRYKAAIRSFEKFSESKNSVFLANTRELSKRIRFLGFENKKFKSEHGKALHL